MAGMDRRSNHLSSSPLVIGFMVLGVAMVFATVAWLGARRESAALYGIVRSIEFPYLHRFAPHAEWFGLQALRNSTAPGLTTIYENSLVYGLFFTALILVLMMLALLRLDRFSIRPHVSIRAEKGRSPPEVMERLARDEPSTRFFLDYDVLDLPTNAGTARQPMRAIELLLYTNTIRSILIDPTHTQPPTLRLDIDALRAWMTERFGPENPFMAIPTRRLLDAAEIDRAVDDLSWYAVLVLYPALRRIHAFHVEGPEGFQTTQDGVDRYISGTWTELNGFKKEFRDGIALGFSSAADREERNALYRARRDKAKRHSRGKVVPETEIEANTALDDLTDLGRVYRQGRIDRGEIAPDGVAARSQAGPVPSKKPAPPENLLFFGEVLSERGPRLACVAQARKGLKDILSRHLGVQRKSYPVGTDPKTGLVTYATRLTTPEQKAFNTKAQERLGRAQKAIESVLWGHQFEFSVAGGALEMARRYGILPPNLFRWMRFCEETTPLWWFVQNLGMPAAYPENAGHYEHYQAEKAMGVAVERPYIDASLDGIRQEADRYLVPERVDELRTILGKDAIVTQLVDENAVDSIMPAVMDKLGGAARDTATSPPKPARSDGPIVRAGTVPPVAGRRPATQDGLLSLFDLDED
jgi:hypothetical protein